MDQVPKERSDWSHWLFVKTMEPPPNLNNIFKLNSFLHMVKSFVGSTTSHEGYLWLSLYSLVEITSLGFQIRKQYWYSKALLILHSVVSPSIISHLTSFLWMLLPHLLPLKEENITLIRKKIYRQYIQSTWISPQPLSTTLDFYVRTSGH